MSRTKDNNLHILRRKQILDAAKRLFASDGFHKTSMRQILDASGISAGGAYNYFSSKAEIVKCIVAEERSDIELLKQILESTDDPVTGIANLVATIIENTDHENAVLSTEIYAEACRNNEIGKLTRSNTAQLLSLISSAITQGKKMKVIAKQYTTADLSEWVVALLEGYIGRIASDENLNPKRFARMAKNYIEELLADTK